MNIAIVPIRDDSTRLPRKATGFKLYKKYTPLECIIERLNLSMNIDKVIFIVPDTKENDNICNIISNYENCKKQNYLNFYKGSVNDISGRALSAINYLCDNDDNLIINITGDCPLVDPAQIDSLIKQYYYNKECDENEYYFITNVLTRSFPDGFDIQIYDQKLLELSYRIALDKKEVTQLGWDIINYSGYINEYFKIFNYPASEKYFYPDWFLTLDYKEDAEVIRNIYNYFGGFDFTVEQVVDYVKSNLGILEVNKKCRRNIPGC